MALLQKDDVFRGKVRRLQLERFEDERGELTPLDFGALGFPVVRAFIVRGANGAERGGHAHRLGRQILMLASGEVDVELRCRDAVDLIRLDATCRALLIEPRIWSRQTYRGRQASLVVFCDTAYDPEDYITDPSRCGGCP